MKEKRVAHYALRDVQAAVRERRFLLPFRVKSYLTTQGWSVSHVVDCLQALTSADFHKSQQHRDRPGVWLDIYRPTFEGQRYYIKLMPHETRPAYVVLSFCRDGEEH